MRDVQSDERVAFGFDVNAASVGQLLSWVYPALYPVHDAAGDWGRPGPDGRRAAAGPMLSCVGRLLLSFSGRACQLCPGHGAAVLCTSHNW